MIRTTGTIIKTSSIIYKDKRYGVNAEMTGRIDDRLGINPEHRASEREQSMARE